MIAETHVEYERGIVHALLDKPERLPDLVGVLLPEHFTDERCRFWYEAMLAVSERGEPLDIAVLGAELARRERFMRCGGYSALFEMQPEAPLHSAHLKFYVREITREARRLRIADLASKVGAGEEVGTELMSELFAEQEVEKSKREPLGSLARSLAARAISGLSLNADTIPTPWPDLNDAILGLSPGTLTLVAARPGRGKTVFLTEIARYTAERGDPVLFFSLEMSREGITTRLLSSLSSVDHSLIRRGSVRGSEKDSVVDAAERIAEFPLELDDQGGLSIQQMRAMAKAHKERGGLALVCVDYAQLATDPRAERRLEEMAAVSRGLKDMAKELRVPVLAAVQLNRQGENEKPRLSHIRECGQFEQDADMAIFLWMDEALEHHESPEIEAWIMKNRQGPGGRIHLIFQKSRCRIVSAASVVLR